MNINEVGRPKIVNYAVNMSYAVLVLGFINILLEIPSTDKTSISISILFISAIIIVGIILFLIISISKGKNWARITFLILFLLGLVPWITTFLQVLQTNLLSGIISFVQCVLEIIALIFLFRTESSVWFRRNKDF
jgi:hypothetical protein